MSLKYGLKGKSAALCLCGGVLTRCTATGRICMSGKTGSCSPWPLSVCQSTCMCVYTCGLYREHGGDSGAPVYCPANKSAKFILWSLYVTLFQCQWDRIITQQKSRFHSLLRVSTWTVRLVRVTDSVSWSKFTINLPQISRSSEHIFNSHCKTYKIQNFTITINYRNKLLYKFIYFPKLTKGHYVDSKMLISWGVMQ